jgi:V8-like Glu-specific endopeptidase
MARVTLLAVLGLLGLGCTGVEAAPTQCVNYDSQEISVEPTYVTVSGILKLDGLFHTCGGVLLGPKTVLTAGHCVFRDPKITAYDGRTANALETELYDWIETKLVTEQLETHDIGMIRLATPITLSTYAVVTDYDATGERAVSWTRKSGTQRKSETRLFSSTRYSIHNTTSVYPNVYLTNRYAQGGDSGSPVFLRGTNVVVGITSGVSECTGLAARTDVLSSWINDRVNAWSE